MTFSLPSEVRWHDDGHAFHLEVQREAIRLTEITCPHDEAPDSPCGHRHAGCLVRWFLTRYGLDCNVGVCPAEPVIRIAWSLHGNTDDLDLAQVWVIPTSDPLFASWLAAQGEGDK
jgi:hypothetical protein